MPNKRGWIIFILLLIPSCFWFIARRRLRSGGYSDLPLPNPSLVLEKAARQQRKQQRARPRMARMKGMMQEDREQALALKLARKQKKVNPQSALYTS
jgi:hypothetical protein